MKSYMNFRLATILKTWNDFERTFREYIASPLIQAVLDCAARYAFTCTYMNVCV